MRKHVTRTVISLMALSQAVGVVTSPMMTVQAETYTLTEEATTSLNKTKESVVAMTAKPNKETVKQAMNAFVSLFSKKGSDPDGDMALLMNNHAKPLFDAIITGLNKQDNATKNELTVYFFNHMGLRYGNDDSFYYESFLEELTDNTKDPATLDKLMIASGQLNQIFYHKTLGVEGELKERPKGDQYHIKDGQLKAIYPMDVTPGPDELKERPIETVEVNHDISSGITEEFDLTDLDTTWEDVYYETVDGKPIRVTVTYTQVNGETTSTVKREVVPEHVAYAGTEDDWAFVNDSSEVVDIIEIEDAGVTSEEDENTRSNMTLHYTVTKGMDEVYYYDTGMRVSKEDVASYQQVKDVLYQLALRAEGYLAEDEGKFLIVVEGKPILIREAKETYTKKEVEAMFKGFGSVDMRIMPTRIGTTASLEEQLVSGKAQSVTVNGEEANLTHHPLVEDGHVLLSIGELADLLNIDYSEEGSKLTLKNEKNTLIYEENVKAVTLNGLAIDTATPSIRNEDGALMGDITEFLNVFHVDMIWDEENSTIQLETAQASKE